MLCTQLPFDKGDKMNLNLIYTDLIVLANSKESHSSEQVAEMLSCLLEASVQFKIKEDDRLKAKMKKR